MMKKTLYIFLGLMFLAEICTAQSREENKSVEYISWSLIQLIPSPTIYQDANGIDSKARFGLKWQIIPINFSFDANKYVSPVQFFMINPVRRFSGSAELFVQPELATAPYTYSDKKEFSLSTGARVLIPIVERGENLFLSLGGKYTLNKKKSGDRDDYPAFEAGAYFFSGILGFQYTRNFNTDSKYNFSLYIKYY